MLAFLTGCQDEDVAPGRHENEADSPMNAVFELSLTIQENDGRSRAASADSTLGNTMERRISSVQLFIVPVDEQGNELWNQLRFGQASVPENFKNPVKVQVPEITSTNHVYVGANMNQEQTDAFIRSKNGYYEMKREFYMTYYSAINQLAPFPFTWPENYDRNPKNIVMFATAALKADRSMIEETIDATTGEKTTKIDLGTAYLKRMVAKVLLTCNTVDGKEGTGNDSPVAPGAITGVGYVETARELLDSSEEKLGATGWIRQEDVYYFINNMPRRVKFIQEYEDKNLNGEREAPVPNYNLKNTIKGELGVKFSPIKFTRDKIKNVYIHYDILELYKRNLSFRQSKVWKQTDYDNLLANQPSAYSEEGVGMYTAENMFGVEEDDFTPEELNEMKEYNDLPFLTKVAIAAKFTPRFIFVTRKEWEEGIKDQEDKEVFAPMKDQTTANGRTLEEQTANIDKGQTENYLCLKCANEEVAWAILTYSLKIHGHLMDEDKEYDAETAPYLYPESTFFTFFRENEIFYSSYGVASVNNPDDKNWEEMIPYARGWSYYYTYINNERPEPVEHVWEICIERNNYYILRLKTIGSLGTSVSYNKYIQVHTLKSDWQDGGKGEITIH